MPLNNIMEDPDFQRFFPFFLAIKKNSNKTLNKMKTRKQSKNKQQRRRPNGCKTQRAKVAKGIYDFRRNQFKSGAETADSNKRIK